MSSKNFFISDSVTVDSFKVSVEGVIDGQSLVYDGTQYAPADIVPVGAIEMWAGETTNVPYGWLLCDGSAISRTTYSRLFTVLGESYGSGDGVNTFNLPDAETKVPIGLDGGDSRFATGSATLASGDTSHSHTAGGPYTSNNNTEASRHNHGTTTFVQHTHSLTAVNATHSHITSGPSSTTHTHDYNRGTGNTVASTASAHTNHNGVGSEAYGGHDHQLSASSVSHAHTYNALASESHSHSSWGTTGAEYNSGGGESHNHTINTQRIYFIIKI